MSHGAGELSRELLLPKIPAFFEPGQSSGQKMEEDRPRHSGPSHMKSGITLFSALLSTFLKQCGRGEPLNGIPRYPRGPARRGLGSEKNRRFEPF